MRTASDPMLPSNPYLGLAAAVDGVSNGLIIGDQQAQNTSQDDNPTTIFGDWKQGKANCIGKADYLL